LFYKYNPLHNEILINWVLADALYKYVCIPRVNGEAKTIRHHVW